MLAPIDRAVARALALTLSAAIIATGCLAVHLTHVQASVTIRFGEKAFEDAGFLAPRVDPAHRFIEASPVMVEPLVQAAVAQRPNSLPELPDKPRSKPKH